MAHSSGTAPISTPQHITPAHLNTCQTLPQRSQLPKRPNEVLSTSMCHPRPAKARPHAFLFDIQPFVTRVAHGFNILHGYVTICYSILLSLQWLDTRFGRIPVLQACNLVSICFFCYSSCIQLFAREDVRFLKAIRNIPKWPLPPGYWTLWFPLASLCSSWNSFKSQH